MRRRHVLAALAVATLAGCSTLPPASTLQLGDTRIAVVQRGGGSPVAVFQAGLGDGSAVWSALWERLEPGQPVFAYDRPGYGDSSAAKAPRDPCAIAEELHAALKAAHVPPPYLLVGHSIGGLYQAAFAKLYPAETAAVLLLDPTHPEHWATLQREVPAMAGTVSVLRNTAFGAAMRLEFDDQAACNTRLAALPAPAVPARLLVRSRYVLLESGAFEAMARGLQQRWLADWPGLQRVEVQGSGHYIQKDRPEAVSSALAQLRSQLAAKKP